MIHAPTRVLSLFLAFGPIPFAWSEPVASSAPPPTAQPALPPAVFRPGERAVSTWRTEAATHLDLAPDAAAAFLAGHDTAGVARCIKLNNYWCIKKAGWAGEIAADGEGHVAFASAPEGAAVAALLLKRYYVDFNRKTALAIIARWAPAECGSARLAGTRTLAKSGLGNTLRARWLASRRSASVAGTSAKGARPRRSVVADRLPRLMPTPSIAVGLGETDRPVRPITLDALMQSDPHAPRSRSMLGSTAMLGSSGCSSDTARVAAYAAKAAAGIKTGPDGDLGLFDATGTPTDNLATMMANMARVEIGPLGANAALIRLGIAGAFKPGRNPS